MNKKSKTTAAKGVLAPPNDSPTELNGTDKVAAAGRIDTASLDIKALATVILARAVKPRVGDVRRLAEAALGKKAKKKTKKDKKKSDGSERKLSKIPTRKAKK